MGDAADEASKEEGSEPPSIDSDEGRLTRREEVARRYDFDNFGPADMAEMTIEEWEAVFDPEAWITGPELVDRVEADLRDRIRRREVFAVVERFDEDGEERLLAYTDVGYAIVRPDGTVEGEGTIRRDIEPVVALCAMDDYEVPDPPEGQLLPDPTEITAGSGELGNLLLQVVAVVQLVAGVSLLAAPLLIDLQGQGSALLTTVAGLGFLVIGVFLLVMVANARLSDRFRAEEYRQRLRAAGVGTGERPDFLPVDIDDDN